MLGSSARRVTRATRAEAERSWLPDGWAQRALGSPNPEPRGRWHIGRYATRHGWAARGCRAAPVRTSTPAGADATSCACLKRDVRATARPFRVLPADPRFMAFSRRSAAPRIAIGRTACYPQALDPPMMPMLASFWPDHFRPYPCDDATALSVHRTFGCMSPGVLSLCRPLPRSLDRDGSADR